MYLSIIFDHNVAVVPVSYPKDKCSYTVAGAGPRKQINSHIIPAHTGRTLLHKGAIIVAVETEEVRKTEII